VTLGVLSRLSHGFNAFLNLDQNRVQANDLGASYSFRPDRVRLGITNERSIISSVYTRLAIDVSQIPIKHVRLDETGRYLEDIKSGLHNCLNVEANLDQAGRAFLQDIVMTLCDKGVIAIVPVDTTVKPENAGSYDVQTMRVGEVLQWYPQHVRVLVYNDQTGRKEEVILEKRFVAIVENPLYTIMNEPNSTLQRLLRKLNLLDTVDEQSSSGKLDMIIQLPYVIKSEARRQQAEQRRKDIEFQLKGSQYGIAYTDGTERITQLNRPAENNLLNQVKYLTELLYSQLGITAEVMSGTADEKTMLNYYNRTVEPIITAVVQSMHRTFLTKTARSQGQAIRFFRDVFALVPISDLAEIADKFTRNEIATSNEFRQVIGFRPVTNDPKADQLRNSNMPQSELGQGAPAALPAAPSAPAELDTSGMDQVLNEVLDGLSAELDKFTQGAS
jgi:hypothetical protein